MDATSAQPALHPIVTYHGHADAINNLVWSPDGQSIASASEDVTVQIWHSLTGQHIFTYEEHTKGGANGSFHGVTSVTWSPMASTSPPVLTMAP